MPYYIRKPQGNLVRKLLYQLRVSQEIGIFGFGNYFVLNFGHLNLDIV
jgi:hypothetical protein